MVNRENWARANRTRIKGEWEVSGRIWGGSHQQLVFTQSSNAAARGLLHPCSEMS